MQDAPPKNGEGHSLSNLWHKGYYEKNERLVFVGFSSIYKYRKSNTTQRMEITNEIVPACLGVLFPDRTKDKLRFDKWQDDLKRLHGVIFWWEYDPGKAEEEERNA